MTHNCQRGELASAPSEKPARRSLRLPHLLALFFIGCGATPVGPPPPAPLTTSGLYFFASPAQNVRLVLTVGPPVAGGPIFPFFRDPALDNFQRPAGTDPSFVAYSTGQLPFVSGATYEADLERNALGWQRVDDVKPWVPNTKSWYRLDQD